MNSYPNLFCGLSSRRQWDGLIKHWKIRIHEWEQTANDSPEKTSENSNTTKRSNDGKKKEDTDSKPKDYYTHWLDGKDRRVLDWSEECELEEKSNSTKEDDDVETKRRKTTSSKC